MIPEIKLLMPLVGLSLPERSGGDTPHQERAVFKLLSFPMPGAEIYLYPIGVGK